MARVILGMRNVWGKEVPFGLSPDDRRQGLYIIGKSGTGKTTLVENMIAQDIENGCGVGFFDPHGDSARRILDRIPKRRTREVMYFDLTDRKRSPSFNLLAHVPRDKKPLVASSVLEAFRGVWGGYFGPRMEIIMENAIMALLDCEHVSLAGLYRMLSDDRYRAWVVRQVKDPLVRYFWEREFAEYANRYAQEAVAPVQNKVGKLLISPIVRNVLAQVRNSVEPRALMDGGGIFVANLAKGVVGPDKAGLVGAFLATTFQLAAMSRENIPEESRRPFYLYIDEFQSFVTDTFVGMLSEVRKYGLCLVLAHQYRSQLTPAVDHAVTGNVGSCVAFRVGHKDAEALEKAFGQSFKAPHFTSLGNGEVYAKLLSRGQDSDAFLGRTFPPSGHRHGRAKRIIRSSRQRYGARRSQVERKTAQWLK